MSAAGPHRPRPRPRSAPRRFLRALLEGGGPLAGMRRVRPTREGWIFSATMAAVAGAALNTGNNLLYLVFALMLGLVALSGVLSETALQRVVVHRALHERLFAGRPARGTWTLRNPRRLLPNLALGVQERPGRDAELGLRGDAVLPLLAAGRVRDTEATWRFERRGRHRLSGVRLSTVFPFGILRKWYDVERPADVLVYPEPIFGLPPEGPRGARPIGVSTPDRRAGAGEFRGLRDHRPGEDARRVHWRSSARRRRWMVAERDPELDRRRRLDLVPPTGRDRAARFERMLSEATGAVLTAEREGVVLELSFPGEEPCLVLDRESADRALARLALWELPEGGP